MNKPEILDRIVHPGIVAIIRADSSEQLLAAAEALCDGGVTTMEVSLTTPNALQVIHDVAQRFGERILIGVGTVLDPATCRAALVAGAQFVVTPVTRPEVIQMCNRHGIPIASGAYTPTEALAAHEAGADFVKIFPADQLGPLYMKNLLAPLPQLRLMPTGGVSVANIDAYTKAGCVAFGVGSSLVNQEILKTRDWKKLAETAAGFVAAVQKARG